MILGLCGKLGSGKDTVGDVMTSKFKFSRVSFADSLKYVCVEAFNLPVETFYDRDLKDKPFQTPLVLTYDNLMKLCDVLSQRGISITEENKANMIRDCLDIALTSPRHLLQYIGTDCCRKYIDDSIWLKIGVSEIKKRLPNVVVTDVRFDNEKHAIKGLGGKLGLVRRVNNDLINPQSNHSSEQDSWTPDDYNFIFNNDEGLAEFKESVELWYTYKVKQH